MLVNTTIKGGSSLIITVLIVPPGKSATLNLREVKEVPYKQEKIKPIAIITVRGNGSGDDIFKNALIVMAEQFGSEDRIFLRDLDGKKRIDLEFTIDAYGQIIALLPEEIVPGHYQLKLLGIAGSDKTEIEILKGEPGIGITWLGSFVEAPFEPALNDAYYDISNGASFVYDGNDWMVMTMNGGPGADGSTGPMGEVGTAGPQGATGSIGPSGQDGTDGADGQTGPQGVQGFPGDPGPAGISLTWLGTLADDPVNPLLNTAYYDSIDGVSYIFDGTSWQLLTRDGIDGSDGAIGPQGEQGPIGPGGGGGGDALTISSTPALGFTSSENFSYQVVASSANSANLFYYLLEKPVGMTIGKSGGLVSWNPASTVLGSFDVLIIVSDDKGGSANQAFTLTRTDDSAPTFAGLSSASAVSALEISLSWTSATDNGAGTLTYKIYQAGGSAGQNYATPTYSTTNPTGYTVGGLSEGMTYYFVVRVCDQLGNCETNGRERSASTPLFDADGDGVVNEDDSDPTDRYRCHDADEDSCDECASGTVTSSSIDGLDSDGDGLCNIGDADDDDDGFADGYDAFPTDSGEWFDSDGDGIGNNADTDDDNDTVLDIDDSDPTDRYRCHDDDEDSCDECASGTVTSSSSDGLDSDGDGLCNIGDADDDNDTVLDIYETATGVYVSPSDSGTDPLLADSDGDGVDDGAEILAGTDPTFGGVDELFEWYFGLVPSGQSSCYNGGSSVGCASVGGIPPVCGDTPAIAFCGQDAQYAADDTGRYSVSGTNPENIVQDTLTGLTWQQDGMPTGLTWQGALDYCTGLVYAGFDDWRLPAIHELDTIVDLGISYPAIDGVAFPSTPPNWFWSSSSSAYLAAYAWRVYFGDGYVNYDGKSSDYAARCVRP